MAEREEEGRVLPSGTWGWDVTPWSPLASLHCCDSSRHVSESIFSVLQQTWQVWGPALSIQAPVTLHTSSLCFFRLRSLALTSRSCVSLAALQAAPESTPNCFLLSRLISCFLFPFPWSPAPFSPNWKWPVISKLSGLWLYLLFFLVTIVLHSIWTGSLVSGAGSLLILEGLLGFKKASLRQYWFKKKKWITSKLNFARMSFIELFEFCAARIGLKSTWKHFPAVN